jgi:uncharacterized membrane protein YphA (DoxX/SURF4 family)
LEEYVNTFLWILQGFLAFVFLGAGMMKLVQSREQLISNPNMKWVEDIPSGSHRIIGALEVAAAVGLILPPLLGIAPWLAALAAAGLALTMLGAMALHAKRRETPQMIVNAALGLVATFVAYERFGPNAF